MGGAGPPNVSASLSGGSSGGGVGMVPQDPPKKREKSILVFMRPKTNAAVDLLAAPVAVTPERRPSVDSNKSSPSVP